MTEFAAAAVGRRQIVVIENVHSPSSMTFGEDLSSCLTVDNRKKSPKTYYRYCASDNRTRLGLENKVRA